MRLTIEQPDGASISATSYSVDISSVARRVAFTARDSVGIVRVYVRAFDDVQWQRLDGTEGVQQLYFSPDGAWIAFAANGKLKKIPATGGSAILLADITNAGSVDPLLGVLPGSVRLEGKAELDLFTTLNNDGTPQILNTVTFSVDGFKQSDTATTVTITLTGGPGGATP